MQAGIWKGVSDNKPEDGWVLLSHYFGTINNPLDSDFLTLSVSSAPYFILYNKFTGIIRLFALVPTDNLFNNGYITLEFKNVDGLNQRANFLTFNESNANGITTKLA